MLLDMGDEFELVPILEKTTSQQKKDLQQITINNTPVSTKESNYMDMALDDKATNQGNPQSRAPSDFTKSSSFNKL